MAYRKWDQAQIAAGRCIQCGAQRAGTGATQHRCVACVEKNNAARRLAKQKNTPERLAQKERERQVRIERQGARKAAGICQLCRKARTGRKATTLLCAACAKKDMERCAAYRQKKRNEAHGYTPGDGRNAKPLPLGKAAPNKREGGTYHFTLMLDRPSLAGLLALRQRYRDGETRAGRDWQTHQLSRLVREVILRYEPTRATVPTRPHLLRNGAVAHLCLDGRTKAILARQAAKSFNRNKSATLRAMLAACQPIRRAFAARGGSVSR